MSELFVEKQLLGTHFVDALSSREKGQSS